jgi:subtilisin family serine protease
MYVKVKNGYTIENAFQLAGVSYIYAEPAGSLSNTFLVQIENEDIFTATQHLFEAGMVVYAEPSFYFLQYATDDGASPAPSSLPKDWNLKGNENGTYGINALNAWNITTGDSNIKTAILDDGIYLNHTALTVNLLPGVTFASYVFGSTDGAANFADVNGTQVAGIIASTNHTQANYGIAKNSKIVSVKVRERSVLPNGSTPLTYIYASSTKIIQMAWNGL